MSSVILKKASDSFIKRKHPWIFSGAIEKVEGSPSNGETVQIFTSNKTLVGKGSFSPSSQIRVRVWSFNPEEKIDEDFFRRKIMLALEIRKQIIDTSKTNAHRVINADSHLAVSQTGLDGHATLGGRESDGVPEQVGHGVPEFRRIEVLARDLQTALEANPYYRHAVQFGQLGALDVRHVNAGGVSAWSIYEQHCLSAGQRCGNIKPLALHAWSGWPRLFDPHCGAVDAAGRIPLSLESS